MKKGMEGLTPMMQQYFQIKEKHPDCVLFFRLGDFYEMFFDDAIQVSQELELTLTGRDCGLSERAPMCGVPHHAVNFYVEKLVALGHRVAICEQLEDPALAKGLVERDIIRIITPGTLLEGSQLDERANSFLMSICFQGERCGLARVDVTTGEFLVDELRDPEKLLSDELARIAPK